MVHRSIELNVLFEFFQRAGVEDAIPATLYIFGGAAIQLLGGSRSTLDVDYLARTDDHQGLTEILQKIATEQDIDIEESIPDEFIPGPVQTERRHRFLGSTELSWSSCSTPTIWPS